MRRKKILFHSDFSLTKTGFSRVARVLLSYLYNTGKYDIVHYCCHVSEVYPELQKTPWKSIGCMPANEKEVNEHLSKFQEHEKQPHLRSMWYGSYSIDKVIEQERPDFYFGVQDIWGVDYSIDKPWFSKINSVIWTTLDSLPILPSAVQKANKIKNYWIWSDFATKELNRQGFTHVKTMHGPLDISNYHPIDESERTAIRRCYGIEDDRFVVGFVFRNQLRKSVPNLMEGYRLFKQKNPNIKSCLLLHTSFSEGWRIMDLAKQNEIPPEEIWTTYTCKNCRNYIISPYLGEEKDCPKCHAIKSVFTTNILNGVSEDQLNKVYNVMDCYVHPFTSGGQEIPIQEAKLAGLVTAVTNYSCGEEMNYPEAYSIPLEWEAYREFETEFIKATTLKESICDAIQKVYNLSREQRKEIGLLARQFVIDNFSIEIIGKKFEEFLDSCPYIENWDSIVISNNQKKNPEAIIDNNLQDSDWIKSLYLNVLKMDVDDKDSGFLYWMGELARGIKKSDIENFFRETAKKDNTSKIVNKPEILEDLLDKNDAGKRILYVMPEGFGDIFLSTSIFQSIKELYPDCNLYVAVKPEYKNILLANDYIYKIIPYLPVMDNLLFMEGQGNHKGYFEIAFLPYVNTQRFLTYLHNGKSKIAYNDFKQLCI